ncbi:MAG: CRISPR-associated protein Cas4, partial [Sulfolobales archaeon]
ISGNLIHRGLQGILKERFGDSVKTEVEGLKEVILPSGDRIMIRGRADAVLVSDEGNIGIEIKTSRSDINIPHEQHLEQVMIYNWLMDLNYSLLIYITLDRIAQFTIFDKFSESEIIDRITNATFPRYGWECNYCVYSVLCPYKRGQSTK